MNLLSDTSKRGPVEFLHCQLSELAKARGFQLEPGTTHYSPMVSHNAALNVDVEKHFTVIFSLLLTGKVIQF